MSNDNDDRFSDLLPEVKSQLAMILQKLEHIVEKLNRVEAEQKEAADEAKAIDRRITTLENDIKHVIATNGDLKVEVAKKDERITKLEQRVWTWSGVATAVGIGGSYLLERMAGH